VPGRCYSRGPPPSPAAAIIVGNFGLVERDFVDQRQQTLQLRRIA
jgi:hypothetical protein